MYSSFHFVNGTCCTGKHNDSATTTTHYEKKSERVDAAVVVLRGVNVDLV